MYLERILGSRTKLKILAALADGGLLIERELALKAGASFSEVNRQIGGLVQLGVVSVNKVGRSRQYMLNRQHFLFGDLQRLFGDMNRRYMEAAKAVVRHVAKRHEVVAAILIGSVAEKRVGHDGESDIDLIFVCGAKSVAAVNKALLSFINTEFLGKYAFLCRPLVLSEQEYAKGLRNDPFLIKVHAEGVVLHGKKPKRFG